MKKEVLFIFALLVSVVSLYAEDTIVMKTGEKLAVKIFKIDDDNIYYKYTGEDIDYQTSKQKILKVIHQNGRKESFSVADEKANVAVTKGTKFTINDSNREYVAVNERMDAEDKMYILNCTGKIIHVSIYGQNYKSQNIETLDKNIAIPADGKPYRVVKRIESGDLDHYSAFKIVVTENVNGFFDSAVSNDNLYMRVRTNSDAKNISSSTEQEIFFEKPVTGNFMVQLINKSVLVKVYLYDNNEKLILDTGTLSLKQFNKFKVDSECTKAKVIVDGVAILATKREGSTQILYVK